MLDRAFMQRFFDQMGSLQDDALAEKIEQVEMARRTFPTGSEAAADARFMLRHLRRESLQRNFNPQLQ